MSTPTMTVNPSSHDREEVGNRTDTNETGERGGGGRPPGG